MSFRAFPLILMAALVLSACRWTSASPLMPTSNMVAPPLQDGDIYGFNGSDDQEVLEVRIQNSRAFIRYTDVRENNPAVFLTSFDALADGWYIAQTEACMHDQEIARASCTGPTGYFLARRKPDETFELYRPEGRCSFDALSEGALQRNDDHCEFASYHQLVTAFQAKIRERENGFLYMRPYSTIN